MSKWNTLKKILSDRDYRVMRLAKAGIYNWMDDRAYLQMVYRARMGRSLNLENPQLFSEKLQWLKLYDRKPMYTQLVDKYRVREYIAEKLGDEYLIPLLGIWDDPDEIDFDALPNQFVLKCTHNSGAGLCVCRDKSQLDIDAVRRELKRGLKENFYLRHREWPYKDVPRKIICEQYMTDNSGTDELTDYKFFCANGKVDNVMVCLERKSGKPQFHYFSRDWEILQMEKFAPRGSVSHKPDTMDRMFEIAERLSEGFPFVRVDLYDINGRIYFGEMTLYPKGGWDTDLLQETDERLGAFVDLSGVKDVACSGNIYF